MEAFLRYDGAMHKCDLSTMSCLHSFPKHRSLVWKVFCDSVVSGTFFFNTFSFAGNPELVELMILLALSPIL